MFNEHIKTLIIANKENKNRGSVYLVFEFVDHDLHGIFDSHIKNIRKKVAVPLPDLDIIHSVYGIGYRFEM